MKTCKGGCKKWPRGLIRQARWGGIKAKRGCEKIGKGVQKDRHECQKKTGKWVQEIQTRRSKMTRKGK